MFIFPRCIVESKEWVVMQIIFNDADKFVIVLAIGNQLRKRCDSILFYKEYKSEDSGVLQRTVERAREEIRVFKKASGSQYFDQLKFFLISG